METIVPQSFRLPVAGILSGPPEAAWRLERATMREADSAAEGGAPATTFEGEPFATAGAEEFARRAGGRHRDRQGRRSGRGYERGPRDHGAERLREVDTLLRDRRPSAYEITEGAGAARRQGTSRRRAPTSGPGRGCSWPSSTRAIPGVRVTRLHAPRSTRSARRRPEASTTDPVRSSATEAVRADGCAQGLARARVAINDGFSGGEERSASRFFRWRC
jgi:hypothetical protein